MIFWKKVNSQNHNINHVTPRKRRLLHFPCLFGKHSFGAKNLQGIRIWTKILQRLGYWIKKLKTCKFWKTVWIHKVILWIMLLRDNEGFCIFLAFPESIVLNWDFYDASRFEINIFKVVSFWKSLRSQNHDIQFVTPWKHCFSQFLCLYETHVYDIKYYNASH